MGSNVKAEFGLSADPTLDAKVRRHQHTRGLEGVPAHGEALERHRVGPDKAGSKVRDSLPEQR